MSRKQVHRQRRRTERAMTEAFAALDRGERVLALRLARRAREAGAMNPRILLDHAAVARATGEPAEAEDSLRAAIALAPNFAGAFAALADLQWHANKRPAALRLLARARELDPADRHSAALAERFAAAAPMPVPMPSAPPAAPAAPTERTGRLDWTAIGEHLVQRGHAVLASLLSADEAGTLRATLARADGLDRGIALDHESDGRLRYRWFLTLPSPVADLQAELYVRAAVVADALCVRLHSDRRYPPTLADWRRHRGRDAGHRPGARLLMLPPAGFLGAQGVTQPRAFPLRVLIDLGPAADQVAAFALDDRRPGRKLHRSTAATRPGDGVLFGQRERLQRVGGVFGLQRVAWSLLPVPVSRWFLDLPFDDE